MVKIRFHGKEVKLDTLLPALRSAPEISVKADELHTGKDSCVEYHPRPLETSDMPISLYKFEGKYLVLTGAHRIDPKHTYVHGKLVTKHVIQRCQVQDTPMSAITPPAEPFDERPRFNRDERPRNPAMPRDPRFDENSQQGGAADHRPRFRGTGNNSHNPSGSFRPRPTVNTSPNNHGRPNSFPRGPRKAPETQS